MNKTKIKHLVPVLFLLSSLTTALVLPWVQRASASSLTWTLDVKKLFDDGGTITSSDGFINCGATCSHTYNDGDVVTLTVTTTNPNMTFGDWQNGCTGSNTATTCTFTMTNPKVVEPRWEYLTLGINISKSGTGSGTISGSGISCGSTCSRSVADNTSLTLMATPAAGSVFAGWDANTVCGSGPGGSSVSTDPTCTFTASGYGYYSSYTVRATFNKNSAPSAGSATPSPKPAPGATVTPSPAAAEVPAAPSLAGAMVNGAGLKISGGTTIQIPDNKPLVLNGHTIPGGIVQLTIHSTPRTATVTADQNGNWTYTVSGLAPGDHHVDATVTDPKTNKTSPSAQLLAFTLTSVHQPAANIATSGKKAASPLQWLGYLGAVLVVLAGAAFWWVRFRASHNLPAN